MDKAVPKPIIAVDIDDVLSTHAADMVAYSNKTWGTQLTVDDYNEHWGEMWQVDAAETNRRAAQHHASGIIGHYGYRPEAVSILNHLRKRFDLQIVTSRWTSIKAETSAWLERNFRDIFSQVHYAGIWDANSLGKHSLTKVDLVSSIGASYLIDDQLKHCLACAEQGIEAVLFGDYAWNQADDLPAKVTRCKTWDEVEAYFGRRG